MRIKVECVGCGQCVIFCPQQAITVWGRAVIGDNCSQCGVCIPYCPVRAIGGDDE